MTTNQQKDVAQPQESVQQSKNQTEDATTSGGTAADTVDAPGYEAFNFGSPPAPADSFEETGFETAWLTMSDEKDEETPQEAVKDVFADMTPISGLQNLSESIVVGGVRYRPAKALAEPPKDKPQHPPHHQRRRSLKKSEPAKHSHSRTKSKGSNGERRHKKTRSKASLSPVSRSRPIPIPESPVFKGKTTGRFPDDMNSVFRLDTRLERRDMKNMDDDRRGHSQGFHDFGNSYRDHGQGFAFKMSL